MSPDIPDDGSLLWKQRLLERKWTVVAQTPSLHPVDGNISRTANQSGAVKEDLGLLAVPTIAELLFSVQGSTRASCTQQRGAQNQAHDWNDNI